LNKPAVVGVAPPPPRGLASPFSLSLAQSLSSSLFLVAVVGLGWEHPLIVFLAEEGGLRPPFGSLFFSFLCLVATTVKFLIPNLLMLNLGLG